MSPKAVLELNLLSLLCMNKADVHKYMWNS